MGNDVEAAFTDEKTAEVKQSEGSRPFALAGLALLLGVVGVAVGSAGLAKANSNAADAKGAVAPASAAAGGGAAAGLIVDNELPAESEFLAGSKTLDEIVSRGKLKCAIVLSPGFAAEDEDGNLYGMDVDMVSFPTFARIFRSCILLDEICSGFSSFALRSHACVTHICNHSAMPSQLLPSVIPTRSSTRSSLSPNDSRLLPTSRPTLWGSVPIPWREMSTRRTLSRDSPSQSPISMRDSVSDGIIYICLAHQAAGFRAIVSTSHNHYPTSNFAYTSRICWSARLCRLCRRGQRPGSLR